MEGRKHRRTEWAILYLILSAFIFHSCDKGDDIVMVTNHDLPPFNAITLNAVFDVEIKEADHFSLQITSSEEASKDLTFEVRGGELVIDNVNTPLWKHPSLDPPLLLISGKGITRIESKETCNIQTTDTLTADTIGIILGGKLNIARILVDCNYFYYYNSGPVGGELTIKGNTNSVDIFNGTLMEVDADSLICNTARVENGSKSDVHVFVQHRLEYSIRGTGNIYLSGHPEEIVPGQLYSTGKLIQ